MTVRAKAGRRRYILFEFEGLLTPGRFNRTLERELEKRGLQRDKLRLRTVFLQDGVGIVRCSHLYREEVAEALNSLRIEGADIRTLRTSGTLKTLKDWLREKREIRVPGRQRRTKGDVRKRKDSGKTPE